MSALHVRTEIVTTLSVPDGKGNAKLARKEIRLEELTPEAWDQALKNIQDAIAQAVPPAKK